MIVLIVNIEQSSDDSYEVRVATPPPPVELQLPTSTGAFSFTCIV